MRGDITDEFKYVPYPNLAEDPENFFLLDPMALVDHYDDCWGIFHSHPDQDNPLPSENDIASTSFTEYHFIVGWKNKFYIYWYDENIKALKYYKRELKKWPHPRSVVGVKLLSKTRGSSVGLSNAEAFILGRHIEKEV